MILHLIKCSSKVLRHDFSEIQVHFYVILTETGSEGGCNFTKTTFNTLKLYLMWWSVYPACLSFWTLKFCLFK